MENRREFWQVDAFTTQPYTGNPAAVVFEAAGLSDNQMQAIAKEMNLSETVFVLPPESASADYKVRIFTPRSELPFAGHPTVATAHAMFVRGLRPKDGLANTFRQECGIGLVPVKVSEGACGSNLFTMTQATPKAMRATGVAPDDVSRLLGCSVSDVTVGADAEIVSTGVPWLIVQLNTLEAISRLAPDLSAIERVCRGAGSAGITVFSMQAADPDCLIRVRTFAPGEGINEDPVCGSGNGAVAAYIAEHAHREQSAFSYQAEQGVEILRPGKVFASVTKKSESQGQIGTMIKIGGSAVTVLEGRFTA